jgi:hypothetical protein
MVFKAFKKNSTNSNEETQEKQSTNTKRND